MFNIKLTKNKTFVFCFFVIYFFSFLILFSREGLGLYFHPFSFDSFMDLFNMIASPVNSTYPPLSLIPFKLLHLIYPSITNSVELRNNYYGAFFLMIYILSFSTIFLYTIYFSIKGSSKRKVFYSVLFLFSGIVLWAIERANVMTFAFLLSLLFVLFYTENNEKKEKLSYVLIALAISLKLYPGAFLLLLLERKDIKGIISVILDVIIIFVFSFIVCRYLNFLINIEYSMDVNNYMASIGGYVIIMLHLAVILFIALIGSFAIYVVYKQKWKCIKLIGIISFFIFVVFTVFIDFVKDKNIFSSIANIFLPIINALNFGKKMTTFVEGVNVSLKNFILLFNYLLTGNSSISKTGIFILCKVLFIILCIFSFVFNTKCWKKLASIALLCIYIPDFSGTYLLLYLLIPLLFFINDTENDKIDYIYACLLAITTTFLIIPYKFNIKTYYLLTAPFVIISLCVFSLFLLLLGNALYDLIMRKNSNK